MRSGDFEPEVFAGLDGVECRGDLGGGGEDAPEIIRREFQDGDDPARQVLLIANVLIGGDEEIEVSLGLAKEFAVLDAFPALLLRGDALVAGEQSVHRPRDAFVQQDSHAGATKADSDRSNTRHASSRVVVGKHSRNSSSV